jgi:hypothetical protein
VTLSDSLFSFKEMFASQLSDASQRMNASLQILREMNEEGNSHTHTHSRKIIFLSSSYTFFVLSFFLTFLIGIRLEKEIENLQLQNSELKSENEVIATLQQTIEEQKRVIDEVCVSTKCVVSKILTFSFSKHTICPPQTLSTPLSPLNSLSPTPPSPLSPKHTKTKRALSLLK